MAGKALAIVEKAHTGPAPDRGVPEYRAVTNGTRRDQWSVVDAEGSVVFRGDARAAAMIASRLTRPA